MKDMLDIEIFDTVMDHMLAQNKRSTDAYGMCVYRGDPKALAKKVMDDITKQGSLGHCYLFDGYGLKDLGPVESQHGPDLDDE